MNNRADIEPDYSQLDEMIDYYTAALQGVTSDHLTEDVPNAALKQYVRITKATIEILEFVQRWREEVD